MFLFGSSQKQLEVPRLIIQIVNHHCDRVKNMQEGPRAEGRVSLTMAVQVVPFEGRKLQLDRAFPALTKEFSSAGMSMVVCPPMEAEQFIVGLRWNDTMHYLRGTRRHQKPLGAGYWVVGVQLTELVDPKQYPGLEKILV